ncbi:MAG: hypothetical protein V4611_00595 [Patescibacteria group bacterium]
MVEWAEVIRVIGAVILIALLVMSGFIIAKRPIGKNASLSLHFGTHRDTYFLMALFLTFGGALFYSFIWFWLIPTYNLPAVTYLLLIISYGAQLIMSWVPASATNSRFQAIHQLAATIVGISMIIFLILLSFYASNLPDISALFIQIGTALTIISLVLYALIKKLHNYLLIFESLFIAFFCVAMLLLVVKI